MTAYGTPEETWGADVPEEALEDVEIVVNDDGEVEFIPLPESDKPAEQPAGDPSPEEVVRAAAQDAGEIESGVVEVAETAAESKTPKASKSPYKELTAKIREHGKTPRVVDLPYRSYMAKIRKQLNSRNPAVRSKGKELLSRDSRISAVAFIMNNYDQPISRSVEQIERARGVKGAPLTSPEYTIPPLAGPAGQGQPSPVTTGLLGTLYEGAGEQHLPSTKYLLGFYEAPFNPRRIRYTAFEKDPQTGESVPLKRFRDVMAPDDMGALQGGWPYETRPHDMAARVAMLGENAALLDDPEFRNLLDTLYVRAGKPDEARIRRYMAGMIGQRRLAGLTPLLLEWAHRWEQLLKTNPSPVILQQAVDDLYSKALSIRFTNPQAVKDIMMAGQKLLSESGVSAAQTAAAIQAGSGALAGLLESSRLPGPPAFGPPISVGTKSPAVAVPSTSLAVQALAASSLKRLDSPLVEGARRALAEALQTEQVQPTGGLAPPVRFRNPDALVRLLQEAQKASTDRGIPIGRTLKSEILRTELARVIPSLPRHLQVKAVRSLIRAGLLPDSVYMPVPGQYLKALRDKGIGWLTASDNIRVLPIDIPGTTSFYPSRQAAAAAAADLTRDLLVKELERASRRPGAKRLRLQGKEGFRKLVSHLPDPYDKERLLRLAERLYSEERGSGLLQNYHARISRLMRYLEPTSKGSLIGLAGIDKKIATTAASRENLLQELRSLIGLKDILPAEVYGEEPPPPWALRTKKTREKLSGFQVEGPSLSREEEIRRTLRRLDRRIRELTTLREQLPKSWARQAYILDSDRTILRRLYDGLSAVAGEADPERRKALYKQLVLDILPRSPGVQGAPGTAARRLSRTGKLTAARERLFKLLMRWPLPKAQNQPYDQIAGMLETALSETGRKGLEGIREFLPPKSAVAEVPLRRIIRNLEPSAIADLVSGPLMKGKAPMFQELPYRRVMSSKLASLGAGISPLRQQTGSIGRRAGPVVQGLIHPGTGPLVLLLSLLLSNMLGDRTGARETEAA